ncbi:uncharacterized protein HD556DRAFT_1467218 [Suillus plorans]|uniref:Autophagy-related protein 11 n=1 Tax=Suillus plorans TaxID=116603 RepID=A0A9P7IXE3_9AGAM|nr:uncharacterized protein HD556DRAFT_1467218 [Suillus plorans]KAG1796752.1 hypothetical protein HD556DRAFT_1467218 [Suillus plorans]
MPSNRDSLKNAEKYCKKASESDIYPICLVLDPNYKLTYIERQWTPQEVAPGQACLKHAHRLQRAAPDANLNASWTTTDWVAVQYPLIDSAISVNSEMPHVYHWVHHWLHQPALKSQGAAFSKTLEVVGKFFFWAAFPQYNDEQTTSKHCRIAAHYVKQHVNANLRDIERRGSLEAFLNQETGIDQDAVLAYLSDGTRLRTDNTIYVFNKYYLDFDLNDVLHELRVNLPLQPPIEADIFDVIAMTAHKDLKRQAALPAGLDADLEIISRMKIHIKFLSPAVRTAIEDREQPRMLGDYVSNVKMRQVADACARTHEDLRAQFQGAEKSAARLMKGTDSVRAIVMNTQILESAHASGHRAQEILEQASDITALESPAMDSNSFLRELKHLDGVLRNEVQAVTEAKNAYTEQCIGVLRQISALNINIVQLPMTLSNLQGKFRAKNSFSHIQS